MLLSRTRADLAYRARLALYRIGSVQKALDASERLVLEAHMGFHGQWDEHRRFQLEFAKSAGLRPDSSLLEIGCGPLTLGLPATTYLLANRYTGVDVRPEVLDLAWSQIGKAGLASKNPRLIHSTSFGAAELGEERFDFIWSFSVLYHLTDALITDWFAQVSRRLAPKGAYFANLNVEAPESTWLQFPFVRRSVDFYREAAARHGLTLRELGTLESLGFRLDATEKKNLMVRLERAPG
jgi:2-polyprenyl-3-methyl-5-hydroxy-6-metoxy-1,4-benzoquinol methylase